MSEPFEPEVFEGHPTTEILAEQPEEPHWRPWGIVWKRPKPKLVPIHVCANCERIRTVLFHETDRWLCNDCRPERLPIGEAHG